MWQNYTLLFIEVINVVAFRYVETRLESGALFSITLLCSANFFPTKSCRHMFLSVSVVEKIHPKENNFSLVQNIDHLLLKTSLTLQVNYEHLARRGVFLFTVNHLLSYFPASL